MPRYVPEWIGKTPDTPVPRRVKLRNFDAHHGVCHISGRKIGPADEWDTDHVIAIINGGENRESNLAPALKQPHREKTALDVAEKAKVARIRAKHLGLKKPSTFPQQIDPWGKNRKPNSKDINSETQEKA